MSDERRQIIDKAGAELYHELLDASGKDGGKRWMEIIIRKMEKIPCVVEVVPKVEPKDPILTLLQSTLRFERYDNGVIIRQHWTNAAGTHEREVGMIQNKDLEKLKLWLDGQ